jgi:adenylate cyclase
MIPLGGEIVERKLTAILCADVYGYSRLMGEDEEATLRSLSAHRQIIDGLIDQHRGRFVNSAGDSVLAEFPSVVNAVQCAVEIQSR